VGSGNYLLRKFAFALLTIFIVVIINFVLFRILPGDPVRAVIGRNVKISAEVQQSLREQFGLDKPVFPDQFLMTMKQWASGNLGVSWSLRRPVAEILLSKLWNTILLIGGSVSFIQEKREASWAVAA
jgi:peptide/nickel transport system permease protein